MEKTKIIYKPPSEATFFSLIKGDFFIRTWGNHEECFIKTSERGGYSLSTGNWYDIDMSEKVIKIKTIHLSYML
jgi:hypothetical protein